MSNIDQILDSLPDYTYEDVPLSEILAIPGMSEEYALPYHLYLSQNPRLPEEVKEKVRAIITRIRYNTDYINRYNIDYLSRDLALQVPSPESDSDVETCDTSISSSVLSFPVADYSGNIIVDASASYVVDASFASITDASDAAVVVVDPSNTVVVDLTVATITDASAADVVDASGN